MRVLDWRGVPAERIRPLYEREQGRWCAALGWDASSTWRTIEAARTGWGLPGFLAVDEGGTIRGWTYFLPEDEVLHVGGVAAATPEATSALLDALLAACDSGGATGISCFLWDDAPQLSAELARRGFDLQPFLYCSRRLAPVALPQGARPETRPPRVATWQQDDVRLAARLLREAYGPDGGGPFVRSDTPDAWERYVRNLVEQTACGALDAHATRVIRSAGAMTALVLVTSLSRDTAHLAQVAVHPSIQRRGLAARLVEEACAIASERGFSSATLLVAAANAPARRLYEKSGFTTRARFLAASRE